MTAWSDCRATLASAPTRSHVDRPLVDRHRRLLDRLRHRRMGVAGAGEVLGRAAELHQDAGLVDHLAGAEADDVGAEHPVRRRVGEDLDEAVGVAHGARAAVGGERELADLVGDGLRP